MKKKKNLEPNESYDKADVRSAFDVRIGCMCREFWSFQCHFFIGSSRGVPRNKSHSFSKFFPVSGYGRKCFELFQIGKILNLR